MTSKSGKMGVRTKVQLNSNAKVMLKVGVMVKKMGQKDDDLLSQ